MERVKDLIKIAVPGWKSKEFSYAVILSVLLITRTYLSLWLADVNGKIVKAIVNRSLSEFLKRVLILVLFAIPSSTVNSLLEYLGKLLALSCRERLTDYFHNRYLYKMHYYKLCNLDNRISNPDQRLTTDLDKWTTSLANLYLNFTKPVLDIVLFSKKLSELVGWQGPAMTFGWYLMSGIIIRFISPSFGQMTAIEQKLEGQYRGQHSELLSHSEEIAFYNGNEWEKMKINDKFKSLLRHIYITTGKRMYMGIMDSMLVKYGATMIGYTVVGLPVFGPGKEEYLKRVGGDASIITKDYIRNTSLLINLAKAIGRLVVSYKEVQSLAGYTTLMHEMKEVLDELDEDKYRRVMVTGNELQLKEGEHRRGEVTIGSKIKLEAVPIVSPNGDTLVSEMDFEVK